MLFRDSYYMQFSNFHVDEVSVVEKITNKWLLGQNYQLCMIDQ